eukprot:SAG31_NODE_5650_length_2404_cov_1.266811_2_plen_484_part_00
MGCTSFGNILARAPRPCDYCQPAPASLSLLRSPRHHLRRITVPLVSSLPASQCSRATQTATGVTQDPNGGSLAIAFLQLKQALDLVPGSQNYRCFRIPGLAAARSGKLFAFAGESQRRPAPPAPAAHFAATLGLSIASRTMLRTEGRKYNCADHDRNDVVVKSSTDGGRTWGKLTVVYSLHRRGYPYVIGNPSPVVAADGTIFVFMTHGDHKVLVSRSSDGLVWSTPRDITQNTSETRWATVFTGPSGAAFVSANSTDSARSRMLVCCAHSGGGRAGTHTFYSDDLGTTFWPGASTDYGAECEVAQLSPGTLVMSTRNHHAGKVAPYRLFGTSTDFGQTFSFQEHKDLPDPNCEGSIVGDEYGQLYSSNPAYQCCLNPACISANRSSTCQCLGEERATCISDDGRVNMTVLSSLDGRQWRTWRSIWTGPSGYSSLQMLPSGRSARQGRDESDPSTAGRLGLLWEAWANFSERDSPRIRYIEMK